MGENHVAVSTPANNHSSVADSGLGGSYCVSTGSDGRAGHGRGKGTRSSSASSKGLSPGFNCPISFKTIIVIVDYV